MALQKHYAYEVSQRISDEEDWVDDSTGIIPVQGLGSPFCLCNRFFRRLSQLMAADMTVRNEHDQNSIDVFLTRNATSPQPSINVDSQLHRFVRSLEDTLRAVSKHGSGPPCKSARDELWEVILLYACSKCKLIIGSMQRSFQYNHQTFTNLVIKSTRIDEIDGMDDEVDDDLADQIILLHQAVVSYKNSPEEVNHLIQFAARLLKNIPFLRGRLQRLLGNAGFASELCRLIRTLGSPEYAYDTFVRAALTYPAFKRIEFHLMPPKPSPKDVLAAVRPYLLEEDQNLKFVHLQPAAKQVAVELVAAVLHGGIISIHTRAWYAFGFVTAINEDEERHISGLYRQLLTRAKQPQSIFAELLSALKNNSLINMFKANGYVPFLSQLEGFLATPSTKQPTVWRLVHYLRFETYTEPPPVLKRDYGFQYIRNHEELTRLMGIYNHILANINPLDLHSACINGRLCDFASHQGIHIEPKNRRFLQNDYPNPSLGIENNEGLERHRMPLFDRPMRPMP